MFPLQHVQSIDVRRGALGQARGGVMGRPAIWNRELACSEAKLYLRRVKARHDKSCQQVLKAIHTAGRALPLNRLLDLHKILRVH